jgi:hypothetical protein
MALSRSQQILLKRAQREAGLPEDEYRDALETVNGCRSSKDAAWTDRQLDIALAYFEAIHWRKVDAGVLPARGKPDAVFRQRCFWAAKNTNTETSRDRYTGQNLDREIVGLEAQLQALGFGQAYCEAVRRKVAHGRADARGAHLYCVALKRTLAAKRNAQAAA